MLSTNEVGCMPSLTMVAILFTSFPRSSTICTYQTKLKLPPLLIVPDRYYAQLCLSAESFPTQEFPSLGAFWRQVVKGFSQSALATHSHAIAAGGLPRPMEAQYGDEFYRSAWSLLGKRSFLTSE